MTLSAGPGCSDTQSRPLCLLRREVMRAINGSDLYLGARLVVARTASKVAAAELLGIPEDEMWDARDHVLAAPDQVQRLDPNRVVPRDVLRNLSFVRADGTETGLKFDADGGANQQTLRTVRELTDSSALALDALIDWEASPQSPQILTMSLSRGPCFGECPVYTLAFNGDGWVTWLGESFVDRVGLYVGEIGLSAFADLAEFAVKSGFFALDEDFPPPATDLPMYEIVVGTGARDKAARAWGGGEPPPFSDLAERLDQAIDGIPWLRLDL